MDKKKLCIHNIYQDFFGDNWSDI